MPIIGTRRMFLRSASGLALGLPFLPSLLPRNAKGGIGTTPRRFVAVQSQSGQFVDDFWPAWTPAGYQLRDQMYGSARADGTTGLHETLPGTSAKWAPLADFTAQDLSVVIPSSLQAYFDKMLLLRGLDYTMYAGHGSGSMLGNYGSGAYQPLLDLGLGPIPTVDQVLAYSSAFYETDPLTRSLAIAAGWPNSMSDTNYGIAGGPIENIPGYVEPRYLWQDLFGDFMDPGMPTEHPDRKLVNSIYDDYLKLKGHSRLSAADRLALERHMSFLDDIEADLAQGLGAGCMKPAEPGLYDVNTQFSDVAAYEECVGLLVDIACAAMRCDLTRVVTFQATMGVTRALGMSATSIHSSDDVVGDWHDFAHDASGDPNDREHINSLNRWVVTAIFQRFLEQLDVEEGADGETYLDNSLVYFGGELSMDHYSLGMPTILAGGAGGHLSTGHYVDYTQMASDYANEGLRPWGVIIPGIPHNRLMVTILQAMGLSPADYEQGGAPGYGHAAVFDAAYGVGPEYYAMADIGKPLPGIFTP
jgi:Protein of unknown function (DUF1552)